jgi:drug/metabolite transporter (DMT)-like permease
MLAFLAAVWGASYMFIKVAVEEIEPTAMMFFRLVIAAALLTPFVLVREGARSGLRDLASAWRAGLVLGTVNAALPFTLIAWGETHIDSGVAAIANATVPLFVVLLAIRVRPSERVTGARLAGVLLGFAGVVVLAGAQPGGGWWAAAGTLAVVTASLAYAVGGLYGQGATASASAPVLATASMIVGALVLLPFAAVQLPTEPPGWKAVASVVALAVAGTTLAQIVVFRMLRLHGATRMSLVTYLLPVTALAYGAILLDEQLTVAVLAGLALILPGVALASGALRLPRRRQPAAASPPA